MSGLLDILKISRYNGMFLGVSILVIFSIYLLIMLMFEYLYMIAQFLECGSGPRPTSK